MKLMLCWHHWDGCRCKDCGKTRHSLDEVCRCKRCGGTFHNLARLHEQKDCQRCRGLGEISSGIARWPDPCPDCGGTGSSGRYNYKSCTRCGSGVVISILGN